MLSRKKERIIFYLIDTFIKTLKQTSQFESEEKENFCLKQNFLIMDFSY